jgi:acyl carrier protein
METIKPHDALTWISGIFEEPPGRIAAATRRHEIAGWDSLGTLSLIAALDERFDINLSESDIEGMQSVDDILAILRRHGAIEG